MFNWGGPVKQGIMHGIREPYKHGGLSKQFNTGLVGDERYPKTAGREHHVAFIPPLLMAMGRFALRPFGKYVAKQIAKRGVTSPAQGVIRSGLGRPRMMKKGETYLNTLTQGSEKFQPNILGRAFQRDPITGRLISGRGYIGAAGKRIGSVAKGAVTTPTGVVATGITAKMLWPDGTPKTTTELIEDNVVRETGVPGGGDKGMKGTGEWFKKEATAAREAKAKADKEKRINALLDTMGYDKARKTAAYDALIDAGRMVSERGTLDPKNIGRELIDPIIAATSARFDKPEQIREAVGLMQTKADIQKEMNKEETALANRAKRAQIAVAEKTLAGNTLEETAEALYTRHGTWPSGEKLANLARNKGIAITEVVDTAGEEVGDAVEYMEGRVKKFRDQGIEIPPGNYVVDKSIIIIDSEGNVSRR